MGLREPWFEPLMQKSVSVRVTLAPDAHLDLLGKSWRTVPGSTGVRG
jgi:hypothetical protein